MKRIRKPLYFGVRLRRDGFKRNFVVYNKQPFTEFDTGIPKTSPSPAASCISRASHAFS